jgi:hypothetical protein
MIIMSHPFLLKELEMKTKLLIFMGLLVFLSLVISACAPAAPTVPPVPTSATANCRLATKMIQDAIVDSAVDVGKTYKIGKAWTIKSDDYSAVWYVSALLYDDQTKIAMPGVWAKLGDTLDAPGLFLSVNSAAASYTEYPITSKMADPLNGIDNTGHGFSIAINCAIAEP